MPSSDINGISAAHEHPGDGSSGEGLAQELTGSAEAAAPPAPRSRARRRASDKSKASAPAANAKAGAKTGSKTGPGAGSKVESKAGKKADAASAKRTKPAGRTASRQASRDSGSAAPAAGEQAAKSAAPKGRSRGRAATKEGADAAAPADSAVVIDVVVESGLPAEGEGEAGLEVVSGASSATTADAGALSGAVGEALDRDAAGEGAEAPSPMTDPETLEEEAPASPGTREGEPRRGRRRRRGRGERGEGATADRGAEQDRSAEAKGVPADDVKRSPTAPGRAVEVVHAEDPVRAALAGERGQIMVVNDTPGEECRIAVLQPLSKGGRLEMLLTERAATATQVGNIYKGRVTNVEPAIQAAFIDFGEEQSGFLHISDLHPRYFPDGDKTERVGKKIPRRERPLMQEALRRGDEVLVQVLKQGIGTKGPTLTSYLSIPGRLLVMMPGMDKSGVSRKVEDEEQRREMRKILDSLNLPEGFGFILRTAGFERTKAELQRDAAYLLRLWKVMEKRIETVGAPCALYTESDLLVRTIRDVVDSSIDAIVVDSRSAFKRAKAFLEVVAPRSAPRVIYYDRPVPIFHAFDVERQIELTHSRVVPLPSGGALVIDQTEALVAIDVNSGRSRSARDSETNAFQTNCEAVEEIARQLRLRDLGGVIINDLIDMRSARHRREIEERFRQALKRDRARTTIAPISEFGILEMTRQRMRPSLRKTHYADCPYCDGHGEVKMPDAVAGDALRQLAYLLHYDRVKRVEMACSARVASVLLSSRRRAIDRLEDRSGKRVEIRISDALALDRIDLYAYDERGADIDISRLPPVKPPRLDDLPAEPPEEDEFERPSPAEQPGGRRRRRRRRSGPADATAIALAGGFEDEFPFEDEAAAQAADESDVAEGAQASDAAAPARPAPNGRDGRSGSVPNGDGEGRRRRRRRRRRRGRGENGEGAPAVGEQQATRVQPDVAATERSPVEAPPQPSVAPEPAAPTASAIVDEVPRRIHELAKELDVTSKELLARCREELGLDVKNHMSSVPPEVCAQIRAWYAPAAPAATAPAPLEFPAPYAGAPAAPSEAAPPPVAASSDGQAADEEKSDGEGGRRRRRRRRRRGRGGGNGGQQGQDSASGEAAQSQRAAPSEFQGRDQGRADGQGRGQAPDQRSDRAGRERSHATAASGGPAAQAAPEMPTVSGAGQPPASAVKPPFRPLYGAGRTRKISPAARDAAKRDPSS